MWRKELGCTQEDLARHLSITVKRMRSIEKGKEDIGFWELIKVSEYFGQPSEEIWFTCLDSDDYEGYRIYKKLKNSLRNRNLDKAREYLEQLKIHPATKSSFLKQTVAWGDARLNKNLKGKEAYDEFCEILRISIPDFDESKLAEYRLSHQEVRILMCIAKAMNEVGNKEASIYITETLLANRKRLRTSEEDEAVFLPVLCFNLSSNYGRLDRYEEALRVAESGLDICKEYNNFWHVPSLLLNIAYSHYFLGEKEPVYKTLLIRAYHCAFALGRDELAENIKKYAKEEFGIKDF